MRRVRVLYMTDRISRMGGADQHLLSVIGWAVESGLSVTVAYGRIDPDLRLPAGAVPARCKGLAAKVATGSGLALLPDLLGQAEVVHVQNVMNPVALAAARDTGRAVVTVQDHRVFCPAIGKTTPDGERCMRPMSEAACGRCVVDEGYLRRTLALTSERRDAISGCRLIVLSGYMRAELDAIGLGGASVIPPWVEVLAAPVEPGAGFVLGGRLVRHKGVKDAWAAWRAADSGQPLLLAGEGPLEGELEPATRLGWLGAEQLRDVLRASRALLFPSFWQEPFGILGVEALAAGTPVIVADSGGTSDWSDAGSLRVRPGRPEEMARAIARLGSDADLAVRLGTTGKEMVGERFCRRRLVPRLAELYDRAAERA
jgi:glycosyltransferase involved in cell wall biosynthesis